MVQNVLYSSASSTFGGVQNRVSPKDVLYMSLMCLLYVPNMVQNVLYSSASATFGGVQTPKNKVSPKYDPNMPNMYGMCPLYVPNMVPNVLR